jgi:hypothetical protein
MGTRVGSRGDERGQELTEMENERERLNQKE